MSRSPVPAGIKTFREFWPYYVREHLNSTSRNLHFTGTTLVILTAIIATSMQAWWWLLMMPVFGYGFAWLGHFRFERNRPATFRYPFYSLAGDFVMYFKILTGTFEADLDRAREGVEE